MTRQWMRLAWVNGVVHSECRSPGAMSEGASEGKKKEKRKQTPSQGCQEGARRDGVAATGTGATFGGGGGRERRGEGWAGALAAARRGERG